MALSITPSHSVADLVAADSRLAGALAGLRVQPHHLSLPLSATCSALGLDVESVLDQLGAALGEAGSTQKMIAPAA